MLIAIDKPSGVSSFNAINQLKKVYGRKTKIGHAGTLDPLATGLLLVGTDKDTKRLESLIGLDKTYTATINLSQKSDTRDSDFRDHHEILTNVTDPGYQRIETLLQSIVDTHQLPLPPFSAKKKNGKKGYELARKGQAVIENKPMTIHSIAITSYNFPELVLECHVGSGCYIRSIAYQLGQQLNTGGILTALRRTSIGDYSLENIKCNEVASRDIAYGVIQKD